MQYSHINKGTFLARPNRFIAEVEINGVIQRCHVKNTGRCRELLVPGATVYLNHVVSPTRKTEFDLVAVQKQGLLINMDAQAPNAVFREYVEKGAFLPNLTRIQPEFRYGDSRFDFYLERGKERHLVEVKGVTLEENAVAKFPDAPTERGIKHINGLIAAKKLGITPWMVFVIQMEGMSCFMPNERTHPQFGEALRSAHMAGVSIQALECHVMPETLEIVRSVPILLSKGEGTC